MKTILIPTDFSENSWNAMQYAATLFQEETCKYTLVNAYEIITPSVYNINVSYSDEFAKASESGLQEQLELFKKLTHHQNSWFETLSTYGSITPAVEQMTNEASFDYIVMGTKGVSGIKEVLMGSNTGSVIKRVNCPVICIPEDAVFKHPKNIVFAADYKNISDKNILNPLLQLAENYNAEVAIVNIRNKEVVSATIDEVKEEFSLDGFLDKIPHDFYTQYAENVEEGLQIFIKENNADMIVMMKREHSFLEQLFTKSISKKMAFHTETPLLVIHE
jgi:nucleotide-binding universal stress UspA family protein